jgi:FKBP-type peptidyl-prolyl cis-trans isomerase FkpA
MRKLVGVLCLVSVLFIGGCSKDPVVLSPTDQLVKDIQTIDDYLAAQKIIAVKDPSGLRYVVTTVGTGAKPSLYSNVNVNYVGKIVESGQIFSKSSSPITLSLYTTISGWQIGLPLVNKGSKVTLYIPSGLAYGAEGTSDGSIPSNTNIAFDVEMLLDDANQQSKDIATIDKYLDSLKITAVKDSSGIRYNITIPGSGTKPTLTNTIVYSYSAKLLKSDVVFAQSSGLVSRYMGSLVPPGLLTGMQLLPKGSSATFYIPSSLAYGLYASTDGKFPANSNVIYTVQFSDIQ